MVREKPFENRIVSIVLFLLCALLSCSFSAGGKTVVLDIDIPIEKQLRNEKTTYVIQSKMDLGGKEINIPAHSAIVFKGGQFANGILIGNSTKLKGAMLDAFSGIHFSGSFIIPEIRFDYFCGYKEDTSLLGAMLGLLFSVQGKSRLYLEPKRYYDVDGHKLGYGHALFEFYNARKKSIIGNGATVNDLRTRTFVGYKEYDGLLLFSNCSDISIIDLNYQNLNEDYDTLYDNQGIIKYNPGMENQLGYVGTSYVLIQNNCSHFYISAKIVGARYGVKVGDYSKYWLSGDRGLTCSTLRIVAERTGYPVAIELGDDLDIYVHSDTHHRAAYLCGLSNSVIRIEARNIVIAPYHCLLSDTHYASNEHSPIRYKACHNLDVTVVDSGSAIVTNKDAYCIGFQTYNTKPFYSRKEPLVWSNIKIHVDIAGLSPNIGLFSFSRGNAKNSTDPLHIRDLYNNISISGKSRFPLKQYSARVGIGGAGRYKNISIHIDSPDGKVIYDNDNEYEFDLTSSRINRIYYSGKLRSAKNAEAIMINSSK